MFTEIVLPDGNKLILYHCIINIRNYVYLFNIINTIIELTA